jgi:hypothetical protein
VRDYHNGLGDSTRQHGAEFEVKFARKDERANGLLPVAAHRLIVLREEPRFAAA